MHSQAVMLEKIILVMSSDLLHNAGKWKFILFKTGQDCNKKLCKFYNYFLFIEAFCRIPNFRQSQRR